MRVGVPDESEGQDLMATPNPVSEDDLDSAFREGQVFGVQYLVSEFRDLILRHIKRAGRCFLSPDEMAVVYQDTIVGVIERTGQPGFDPCRSLRMVLTIARNKAVDFLRTRKKHRVNIDYDAILDAVAADTKDTDLRFRWRLKIGSGEAKEVREILLKFIPTLPQRQRIVAQCFVDNFERFRPRGIYKPLADAVSAVTGITESVADVKNDWRYAREKIIAHLQELGYDFFRVE
jgi:DNA-directed RNA polymerase specialized sigma24 family protein